MDKAVVFIGQEMMGQMNTMYSIQDQIPMLHIGISRQSSKGIYQKDIDSEKLMKSI